MNMNNLFYTIAIIIVLIIFMIYYSGAYDGFRDIRAPDGEIYRVLDSRTSTEAAKTLARLNDFNIKLIQYLREKYPDDPRVILLRTRYDPAIISEHVPDLFTPETSYVLNKGESACFCLRAGKTPPTKDSPFDDFDTIIFVNLHEMSHLAESVYKHPPRFWQTFKFLITAAKDAGLHTPVDYSKHPVYYCGLNIPYNPYFDETI